MFPTDVIAWYNLPLGVLAEGVGTWVHANVEGAAPSPPLVPLHKSSAYNAGQPVVGLGVHAPPKIQARLLATTIGGPNRQPIPTAALTTKVHAIGAPRNTQ